MTVVVKLSVAVAVAFDSAVAVAVKVAVTSAALAGAALHHTLAFAGFKVLHPYAPFADVVAHPGDAFAVGADFYLIERVFSFVFYLDFCRLVRCSQ